MSERRRFFPSKSVQTTPGQSVELEVQLRPDAPMPSGDCVCEVLGPAMFSELFGYSEDEEQEPQILQASVPYFYLPRVAGRRVTGAYIQIPGEWDRSAFLRVVLIGATLCDVEWAWSLNTPSIPRFPQYEWEPWWGGVEVTPDSGSLLIEIMPAAFQGDVRWWANLELSATCAGKPAGTVVVRPGNNVWQTGNLPPIE